MYNRIEFLIVENFYLNKRVRTDSLQSPGTKFSKDTEDPRVYRTGRSVKVFAHMRSSQRIFLGLPQNKLGFTDN